MFNLFRVVVIFSAVVSTVFGVVLLFFFDTFKKFNDDINNKYLMGGKYGAGDKEAVDSFVVAQRYILGIICLAIGIFLFWSFVRVGL